MAIGVIGRISMGSFALLGVASSGWGIYYLATSPATIGEFLYQSGGFKLLKNGDDKWKKLTEKYSSSTGGVPEKIKDFTITTQGSTNSEESLMNHCKHLWNTKLSKVDANDKNRKMTEIKTWCIENPIALENK